MILHLREAHRSDGIALQICTDCHCPKQYQKWSETKCYKERLRSEGYMVYLLRTVKLIWHLLLLLHPFNYQLHHRLNWTQDMSLCHIANQVETNFFTLKNSLKHFEKRLYLHQSSTVDLYIQHLKWQNLSEVIAFHLKQFKGFLQWNTLYHKYNSQTFTHCKRRGPLH